MAVTREQLLESVERVVSASAALHGARADKAEADTALVAASAHVDSASIAEDQAHAELDVQVASLKALADQADD